MACFRLFGVEHYTAVMYVQCVIDLFTCLLIAALAGRLFGRRAAMAALWLSALCPFTAIYTAAPLTEVLTLFCIALTFYGLERWRSAGLGYNRWLWVTAVAMAYAVLLRPEQGLLAAAVIPAMLWMVWRTPARCSALKTFLPVAVAALSASCFRWCPGRCGTGARFMSSSRSRRVTPPIPANGATRLSALVSHLGDRLRLHRGGLLELRQCSDLRSATCLPAPSTPTTSTPGPRRS